MKNRIILKKWIIIPILIIVVIIGRISYMMQYYYRHDKIYQKVKKSITTAYTARYIRSPDNCYEISFYMDYGENDTTFRYFMVSSRDLTASNLDNSREIYFDLWKYGKVEIKDHRPKDNFYLEDYIDWQWIDNRTININGKILDITKDKYDFRKDW